MSRGTSRVLLVDDEPGMLRMLKTTLGRYGYETEEALDGREAMELVGKKSFDVIVSDINMPSYPGLNFLRNVHERDPDVPVIMMTAKPTVESSRLALEFGAFRYLVKPVMPAALKEVVDLAARMHEASRAKRKVLEEVGIDDKCLDDPDLGTKFCEAMKQVWVAFQPIVSWHDRRLWGHEALVRSAEPTFSSAAALFKAAQLLGTLPELSRAVQRCIVRNVPADDARVLVGLHALDLNDDELYSRQSALSGIARRVALQITDQVSLGQVPDLSSRVRELKKLGFQLAVNDLGAGNGLTALVELEPNIVKLDASLVRNIDTDPMKRRIVGRVVEMCADLRIVVVAHGIQTPSERDTLLSLGCDKLQGHAFAERLPDSVRLRTITTA